MYRRLTALALAAVLAALVVLMAACNSTNPVAPPAPSDTPSNGGTTGGSVTVSVAADRSQIETGSTQAATLTVSAKKQDGTPASETEVALNTNLGNFGLDGLGNPIQIVKKPLSGGTATVQFFAGSQKGTANILAQVGSAQGKLNLAIADPSAPPVADFSFEVSALSVLFEDTSTGSPTAWSWDFGDGNGSTVQSPLHSYAAAGSYTASLTVTAAGGQSTKRKFVTVEAGEPLIADFSFAVDGLNVLFTNQSAGSPTTYLWDFGDGKSGSTRSPSHTYAQAGTYTVTLTIVNAFGSRDSTSKFVTTSVGTAPVADFQAQTDGLTARFLDASTGSPASWLWNFGDCDVNALLCESADQNPTHTYKSAGTYKVVLTAKNAAGQTAKTKFVTVSLGDPPVAAFEFQANKFDVVFVDRSTGKPASWLWNFGDCAITSKCTSTLQNPDHTYSQTGNFTVVLTVTNAAGSSRATKLVTISNTSAPQADFCYQRNGLTVVFTDISSQSPTAWQWDFGDCATSPSTCKSTAQNPGHTYSGPATFAVTLTAVNSAGQSSRTKAIEVSASITDAAAVCF
jgi:PKD repeat protein